MAPLWPPVALAPSRYLPSTHLSAGGPPRKAFAGTLCQFTSQPRESRCHANLSATRISVPRDPAHHPCGGSPASRGQAWFWLPPGPAPGPCQETPACWLSERGGRPRVSQTPVLSSSHVTHAQLVPGQRDSDWGEHADHCHHPRVRLSVDPLPQQPVWVEKRSLCRCLSHSPGHTDTEASARDSGLCACGQSPRPWFPLRCLFPGCRGPFRRLSRLLPDLLLAPAHPALLVRAPTGLPSFCTSAHVVWYAFLQTRLAGGGSHPG